MLSRNLPCLVLAFATLLPAAELEFSSFLGGDMRELARAVARDAEGNIYITGDTASTNFPLVNAIQNAGEMYLVKLDPTGRTVLFSSYLGVDNDLPVDLVVNADGCVYIAGIAGNQFMPTPGAFQTERRGTDAFIIKLNAELTEVEAATFYGGRLREGIVGIDLDSQGNVYVVGDTQSSDLPTTPGSFQPMRGTPDNSDGVFVAKFSADLSTLIYATHIDTPDTERARDIDVYEFCAYIVGGAGNDNFPTTPNVVQPDKNGAPRDGFLLKLNADGSDIVFSTFIGGDNLDEAMGVNVDLHGYPHVVGFTTGFLFPTTANAFVGVESRNTNRGGFAAKFNRDATQLIYSTYLSVNAREFPWTVDVDTQGAAHIGGVTIDEEYPTTPEALDSTHEGSNDAFYTVLSDDGSRQLYSSFHGGSGDRDPIGQVQSSFDFGDVLVERDCKSTFVGNTDSPDFPLMNAFQPALGGGDWDAYVSRVNPRTDIGQPLINCDGVTLATGTPTIRMLSPRSIATAFGINFTTSTNFTAETDSNGFVTTVLGDACAEVAGLRGAAFATVPTQFNFQVHPDTPLGYQPVRIIQGCGTSNEVVSEPQYVEVKRVTPAFFNFVNNADGVNPIAAIDNTTGALVGPTALFGLSDETAQAPVTTPAQPGQIVAAFATGFGPTNPGLANGQIPGGAFVAASTSSLTLGGVSIPPEDLFYVGASACCAGLDQVVFRVPTIGAGDHPLVLTVDGVESPTGPFIAVQP